MGNSTNGTLIIFDHPPCSPDPDIAGIGVVISFSIAALAATFASIVAAFLDAALLDEKAFLPKALQRALNDGRDLSKTMIYRR